MAKQTALEKAIANIDANIQVLQLARAKLVEQQQAKPAKKAAKPKMLPGSASSEDRA